MLLTTAVEMFILDCQIRRLKPNTIKHYQRCLAKFDSFESLPQQIRQIQTANYSDQYQKNLLVVVNLFIAFCKDEKIADIPKAKLPKVKKLVKKAFTQTEVRTLLKACKPNQRLILLLMLDTGIRLNELRMIDVADVDTSQGLIHIKHGKTGERLVAIGVRVRKEIIGYLNGRKDGSLILSQHNDRYSRNGLIKVFKTLRQRTGIEHCSSHTCRRTFAITALREGVNVYVLAKLMGHNDIQTLRQYLDITKDDLISSHVSMIDNL